MTTDMQAEMAARHIERLEEAVEDMEKTLAKTRSLLADIKSSRPRDSKNDRTAPANEGTEASLQPAIERVVRQELEPITAALTRIADSVASAEEGTKLFNWRSQQLYYPEPVLEGLVLKSDHFAKCHKLPVPPSHDGVFNFRQVEGLPVYGVNQTSLSGIPFVCDMVLQGGEVDHIVWTNLREEPVIYISDTPFSPREPSQLNTNVDYLLSIEGYEIELMESRLKQDVLNGAQQCGGVFPVYQQNDQMQNETLTVSAKPNTVHTLREVYTDLRYRGTDLMYARIPIQDECAPEEKDVVEIVSLVMANHSQQRCAFVFNCQMGRGRTTTGMVICTLLLWALQSKSKSLCQHLQDSAVRRLARRGSKETTTYCRLPSHPPSVQKDYATTKTPEELKAGDWSGIVELCNAIEDGFAIKEMVDHAIDVCATMQNLRTAIYDCKVKADCPPKRPEGMPVPEKLNEHTDNPYDTYSSMFWVRRGLNYLERYFYLILIGEYINTNARRGFQEPFDLWMRHRWGLKRILKKMRLE